MMSVAVSFCTETASRVRPDQITVLGQSAEDFEGRTVPSYGCYERCGDESEDEGEDEDEDAADEGEGEGEDGDEQEGEEQNAVEQKQN
jgi:hypothetical protein